VIFLLYVAWVEIESYMCDRLSMIPESDLDWLLEIGIKRLIINNNEGNE